MTTWSIESRPNAQATVGEVVMRQKMARSARIEHERRLDAGRAAGEARALEHAGDALVEGGDGGRLIGPGRGDLAFLVDLDLIEERAVQLAAAPGRGVK